MFSTRILAASTLAMLALAVGLSLTMAEAEQTDTGEKIAITPVPSLNNVEECQRADLSRSYGKTFRFHRDACWADVSIDENGKVTSFMAEDEDACRKALVENCGWMD